jgi:hypothetical protein
VEQTNVGIRFRDDFTLEIKDESKHAVRSRMLRAKILHENK